MVKPVFSLSSTRPYTDTCSADFERVFSVSSLIAGDENDSRNGSGGKCRVNQVWMVSSTQITPPS